MALGGVGIAVGVLNFLAIKNPPLEPPAMSTNTAKAESPARVTLRELLRSGKFWLFGLAYLFTGFSILIPFTFLSTYAVQELSFTTKTAATLLTAIGIGAIASKITIGPLSDKIGRLKIIFLCGILIGAGSLGMAYRNVVTLYIATVVFSLGYGAVWAMYAAAASDYFAKESSGTIVGFWTLFLGVGSVVSPIAAGWLADTTGTLAWSFWLAAAGAAASIILLIPLWKK
jgi:MFS family permease